MYIDQTTEVDTVNPPDYWASLTSPIERGVRYVDVNADGKADVVRGWKDDVNPSSLFAVYLNTYSTTTNSYSWTATSTIVQTSPIFAFNEPSKIITGGVFGDVNGDGLPDFVTNLAGYQAGTLLGNGISWDFTSNYFSPMQSFPTATLSATSTQLVDVNGDHLEAIPGVIGLGYVGLPLSLAAARAGFKVMGFDINAERVTRINNGEAVIKHIAPEAIASSIRSQKFAATNDFSRLREADVIMIAVPTPLSKQREPDLSYVVNTARAIAKNAASRPAYHS
jgi:hypothetical protein